METRRTTNQEARHPARILAGWEGMQLFVEVLVFAPPGDYSGR